MITRLEGMRLPPFRRVAWASAGARDAWVPALASWRARWAEAVVTLVAAGDVAALPIRARPDVVHALRVRAARRDVVVVAADVGPLAWEAPAAVPMPVAGPARGYRVVPRGAGAADPSAGIPACCRDHADLGEWRDPWWPVAVRSSEGPPAVFDDGVGLRLTLGDEAAAWLLLHALGLPATWHVPCTLSCAETTARHTALLEALRSYGLSTVADATDAIARWPALWSARHGIAEIKTPVLKLTYSTDVTVEHLLIRRNGDPDETPPGAARGIRFPYRRAARVPIS